MKSFNFKLYLKFWSDNGIFWCLYSPIEDMICKDMQAIKFFLNNRYQLAVSFQSR